MITTNVPRDWRDLQEEAARVLDECGFSVEVERTIHTARGAVRIDVYSEEDVDGWKYIVVCECKNWKRNVPQAVIHAFRTVVVDSGANVGYIISSSGFQAGAFAAADRTNLRLVTWEEFLLEFERTWIERFLLPQVHERFGQIIYYTEPLVPREVDDLSEEGQQQFVALHWKYLDFGMLMLKFSPHAWEWMAEGKAPELPLRDRVRQSERSASLPDALLDARGYREFLEASIEFGEGAEAEFGLVFTTMRSRD